MKSSIKIDFISKGTALEPIISIKLEDSDDVRDNLLKTFFQSLGGQSSWLSVSFDHYIVNPDTGARSYITLHPVTPLELEETISIIKGRLGNPDVTNFNPIEKSKGYSLT